MPIEITVPRLGWTMEEGTFVGWLKKEGDFVKGGEPLFTLDGDKALQEVEAIDSGILHIPADAPEPGSTVRVGDLLGCLLAENEKPSTHRSSAEKTPAQPILQQRAKAGSLSSAERAGVSGKNAPNPATVPASPSSPRVESSSARSPRRTISPRALRKAAELSVDWTLLQGTGRGGRIRERDILAALSADRRVAPAEAATLIGGNRSELSPAQPGKVVITDWTFPDLGVEEGILKPIGHQVVARQCKTEAELVALVSDADVVITQFSRLNASVVAAMTKARAIIRYGIGVDNVDLEAARSHGIPVCNVPDYCIHEVADQTLAFILGLTRNVVAHTNSVRSGKWGLTVPLAEMRTLCQLTVGAIGFGRIGREVVKRLVPFKCRVLVFDPLVPARDITAAGAQPATLREIVSTSDVVTLHCPSTPQTRKMISADTLAQMKRGALLVNVARGDLVDTVALTEALQSGQLAGVALDVCDPEPIPAGHPLLKLPNLILAPHIASTSPAAVKKLRETVARLAAAALCGELPPNVVNGISVPRTTL